MRRGLIILLAVLAITFSILLCACSETEPTSKLILTTNDYEVLVEGEGISANTEVEFAYNKDYEDYLSTVIDNAPYYHGESVNAYTLSLSKNGEDFEPSDTITVTIPLARIESLHSNEKWRLFTINNSYEVEPLAYEMSDTIIKFKTKPFKYLVLAIGRADLEDKCIKYIDGEEHDLRFYEGHEPTFSSDGFISHYICQKCGKYYNVDFKEIPSLKLLKLPKLSENILLFVNGKNKGEFTKTNPDKFEWELSGVNLKKDDVITLVDADNNPRIINQTPDIDSNLLDDGKVHDDVENATITLKAENMHSNTLTVSIPGRSFDIYYRTTYDESILVEPDGNGVFKLDNIKIMGKATAFAFMYRKEAGDTYVICEIGENTDQDLFQETYSNRKFYLKKNGIYDISFNPNSKVLDISLVSYTDTSLYNGAIVYDKLDSDSTTTAGLSYNWHYPTSVTMTSFFAVEGRDSFTVLNQARESVEDLTIAKDSEQYIKFAVDGEKVQFKEYGTYRILIDDFTHQVSVEKTGDATPNYVLSVTHLYEGTKGCEMQETETNNVLVYKSLLVYAGDYITVINKKDYGSSYYALKEDQDLTYVTKKGINNGVTFIKSAVYNIYFDTTTRKIDIEYDRSLSTKEKDNPGLLEISQDYKRNSYDMEINPNNINEYQYLNVVVEGKLTEIAVWSTTRYVRMSDIKLAKTDYAQVFDEAYNYTRIIFKEAGTYNIFVNRNTYVLRIVKVA
ncbi:MAG: hypothetical protein K5923_05645 [Clostridia bacterium]|nr:hypothetical protein [Clostridia bacterium]